MFQKPVPQSECIRVMKWKLCIVDAFTSPGRSRGVLKEIVEKLRFEGWGGGETQNMRTKNEKPET